MALKSGMKIPFISNVHAPYGWIVVSPPFGCQISAPPGLKFLWVKFGAQISDPCVEINVYIDYNYNLRLLEMLCTGHLWIYLYYQHERYCIKFLTKTGIIACNCK